jgi:hypothetical protein
VGNDVILHCSSDREVHLCRWKTPYLNTYIVGEGIYVERGRNLWPVFKTKLCSGTRKARAT